MSYMRGDIYVWADSNHVHFWAREGYDHWDEAVWNGLTSTAKASGVALPQSVADEYVVMRMAEMLDEGSVDRFHGTYPPNINEGTHPISVKGPTQYQVVPVVF